MIWEVLANPTFEFILDITTLIFCVILMGSAFLLGRFFRKSTKKLAVSLSNVFYSVFILVVLIVINEAYRLAHLNSEWEILLKILNCVAIGLSAYMTSKFLRVVKTL